MKRILPGLLMAALAFGQGNAELSQIQSVYILKMKRGLDQHMANRLLATGALRVVTDPAMADAVLTDRLGTVFEEQMAELYPPPPPPAPTAPEPAVEEQEPGGSAILGADMKNTVRPKATSFGGTSGAVFLVDRRSKAVLWSGYTPPDDSTTKNLNKTAGKLVSQLQTAMRGKP